MRNKTPVEFQTVFGYFLVSHADRLEGKKAESSIQSFAKFYASKFGKADSIAFVEDMIAEKTFSKIESPLQWQAQTFGFLNNASVLLKDVPIYRGAEVWLKLAADLKVQFPDSPDLAILMHEAAMARVKEDPNLIEQVRAGTKKNLWQKFVAKIYGEEKCNNLVQEFILDGILKGAI